jgi:putative PEP-CTERM system TPR-repeat lipoprotein
LAGCGADSPQSLIASGKEYVAKRDHKAAVIQFKAALQADPSLKEARYLLGKALLDSGDPTAAVVELSKAFDQQADSNLVVPALARAIGLTGDHKKVVNLYGDMQLSEKRAQAALKSTVAGAWGALGNRTKTDAALAASLEAEPDYGPALILQARILGGQRDFDAAAALMNRVLSKEPELYEGWLLQGELLWVSKGDRTASEAAFRKALSVEPAFVPSHLALINSGLRARDIPAAKAQAEQLRAVMPQHPLTQFVAAQIAFFDKDYVKARDLVQQLLKMAPNHVGVLQLAGAVEGQSGSLVLAETYFSKALNLVPELPLARRSLGQTYLRLGQPKRALEVLGPILRSASPDAEAHSLAGDAYLRLGNAEAAESEFLKAMKVNPTDVRIRTAVAMTHLSRGDAETTFSELQVLSTQTADTIADQALVSARVKRREFDAALAAVDNMIRKDPGSATALELKGRVLVARKDYGAAREAFELALKIDPRLFVATSNLAAVDVLDKKPEQAQKRLEASIQSDPRNAYAHIALAELRRRNGAPAEEVRRILEEAIKISPSEAQPRLMLIDLALRTRRFKEALAAAQDAAAALPSDGLVLDAVGRAQMEAGDVEQAVTTFRRLAGVDANSGLPYTRLADVYLASGRKAGAETALRKAIEVEPGLAAAQEGLIKLLLSSSRQRDALELARGMQTRSPKDPSGYAFEALVHTRLKAPDAAVGALRRGLLVQDHSLELGRLLYIALTKSGKTEEAARFAASWLKDHAADVAFEYQVAVNAITQGDLDQAEALLQKVVASRPRHPLALNNLAWVMAMRGKPGAAAHAQKAVDLMPDRPALIDTLAMALASENRADKALVIQQRAVELAPEDNGLRLNLAKIAIQAGDKALARKELERLNALGPDFAYRKEVVSLMKTL